MFDNGLTRDSSGKRTDKTGERDLEFSQWHRKHLSNRCYATDIDFYEYRISSECVLCLGSNFGRTAKPIYLHKF